MNVSLDEFEQLLVEALDDLPSAILDHLENVDVVIEDEPSREQLEETGSDEMTILGLYEGIPHVDRSGGYGMVLPDKITIFRLPVLEEARDRADVKRVVRETIVHEIAHHFGISDERLTELGRY